MKPRPIVQVSSYYPPHLGGQEYAVKSLAQELSQAGHNVAVLTSTEGSEGASHAAEGNILVRRLRGLTFGRAPIMPRFVPALLAMLQRGSVVHLHIGQAFTPEMVWLASKIRPFPYVAQLHIDFAPSSRAGIFLPFYKRFVLRRVLRSAAAVVALNEQTLQLVREKYGCRNRTLIIPNGVDEQYFSIERPDWPAQPPKTLRLLFVGRLSKQKNLLTLIAALQQTTRKLSLDIIGEGEDRPAIEQAIQAAGLRNVTIHGRLPREAIIPYYAKSHVLIIPSLYEAQPLVLLEGMAARIPIIGTNVIGVAEHIRGSGLIAEPTAEGLAAAIDSYDSEYKNLPGMIAKGYRRVKKLRWQTVLKQYQDVYDTAIRSAAAHRRPQYGRWLLVANLLFLLTHFWGWWPTKLALGGLLLLLPGIILQDIIRPKIKDTALWLLYSFGLSLLVLMVAGLAANELLPLLGIQQPLRFGGSIFAWDMAVIGLIWWRTKLRRPAAKRQGWPVFSRRVGAIVFLSSLLPVLAALGAFRLNNGGSAVFAEVTIGYASVLIVLALAWRRRLSDGCLTWFIFSLGLAVLLMTSLRGWDITGHDIEREFRVFTLTHLHSRWQIGLYRDPYNACLSITILPEILARLLGISGLVIFKCLLQIAFAACGAGVFILLRRFASRLGALVGALLFIAFPTFVNDAAMLTRQGVAYLFFVLAALVLCDDQSRQHRKALFLLCSLGVILSHYSTSYMFVSLFAFGLVCKWLVRGWFKLRHWHMPALPSQTLLTPAIVLLLFAMTFVWYAQATATASGVGATVKAVIVNAPKLFSADNKSVDAKTALLRSNNPTQADLYDNYLLHSASRHTVAGTSAIQYLPLLTDDTLPITALGRHVQKLGINPAITVTLRQAFATALQILAIVAVFFVAVRLLFNHSPPLDTDLVCLNVAGVLILTAMTILPVLSVNYGLLRAFQQILIYLLIPIVLFLVRIGRYIPRIVHTAITAGVVVFIFTLFTGLLGQLLGGASPVLSLNNRGLYYGLYNNTAADTAAFSWLKQQLPAKTDARAANFNRAAMHDPYYSFTRSGILPSQLTASTYVYLDPAQIAEHKVYAYYQGSPLIVTFPLNYYDATKNELYSTATTRVYQ